MAKPRVWNRSQLIMEDAKSIECPRCSGSGGIAFVDGSRNCSLCDGAGQVMASESGWVRPLYTQPEKAVLY